MDILNEGSKKVFGKYKKIKSSGAKVGRDDGKKAHHCCSQTDVRIHTASTTLTGDTGV